MSLDTPDGLREGALVEGDNPMAEGGVQMLYARWYEIVIVIFVLLWILGEVGQNAR
jgi:hypothetical protein